MILLPHFYQIACPSLSHSFDATGYLLDTGSGVVLLDCGTPEGFPKITKNIRADGFAPERIQAIYGTHGHYDHVGAAKRFREISGCKLYLHSGDRDRVESGDGDATSAALLYCREFEPCPVDSPLEDGMIFRWPNVTMTVLHTPGHTPGGVCFALELSGLRVLIAGDTLWGGFHAKIGSDEAAWRQSLDKLCALHFDLMTIGHMSVSLLGDADTRLREAREAFGNYYNPWFKMIGKESHY